MPHVVRPSWNLFDQVIADAQRDLIICAPWISPAGVEHLKKTLFRADRKTPLPRVQIWARIADVNTDSPGILELTKDLRAAGGVTVVAIRRSFTRRFISPTEN